MSKFYISTPIYYASDKPHIGHAYTTITADVLARYHRLQGDEVLFSVGTDDHGAKVAKYAAKAGLDPQNYTDQVHVKYKEAWQVLDINYDYFIRTTDDYHKVGVTKALQKVYDAGYFYKKEYSGNYCVGCEAFLRDKDLINGKCPDHQTEPEFITVENWFFKQSALADKLLKVIEDDTIKVRPQARRNEILSFIKEGLEDISISRHKDQLQWGIELPFDKDHVTYVWFDALLNYITLVGYGYDQEKLDKWWPADFQLVGKDILRFHAILWPIMLMVLELPLPKEVYGHGFFTIDGQKISKTIGNVIDPHEIVEQYNADVVRYFILAEIAFGQDGDFSKERLAERYSSDLANGLGNLVSRVVTLCNKLGSFSPDYSQSNEAKEQIQAFWPKYEGYMSECEFHHVLETVRSLVAYCDKYIEAQEPWKLIKDNPDQAKIVLTNMLEIIRHIILAYHPFMPTTTEKIRQAIKWEPEFSLDDKDWGGITNDINLDKIEPLFPRR